MVVLLTMLMTAGQPAAALAPPPAPPRVTPSATTTAPAPGTSKFRITGQLGGGVSNLPTSQWGGGLELGWLPLKYFRIVATASSHVLPNTGPYADTARLALRFVAGLDGVMPLEWIELFAGVNAGAAYSDASPIMVGFDCFDCPYGPRYGWQWVPAFGVRAGVDLLRLRPLVLGAEVSYSPLLNPYNLVHWIGAHARIGLAF